jgi:protein SCO1/2
MTSSIAAQQIADPLKAGFDPHPGARLPDDLVLTDQDGRKAPLVDLLQGQPALLVLGYYGCPMLCHQVQEGLLEGLSGMQDTLGRDFRVLTVSIDPRETSTLAAEKRAAYLKAYGKPVPSEAWPFLVGDAAAVDRLQRVVGFRSARLPDQIAHPAGLVVLSPDGKISSYLYGIRFPAVALHEALDTARREQTSSVFQQVLLLCYQYDPATGRYSLSIYRLIQALALLTLGTLLIAVLGWLRQERRRALAPR